MRSLATNSVRSNERNYSSVLDSEPAARDLIRPSGTFSKGEGRALAPPPIISPFSSGEEPAPYLIRGGAKRRMRFLATRSYLNKFGVVVIPKFSVIDLTCRLIAKVISPFWREVMELNSIYNVTHFLFIQITHLESNCPITVWSKVGCCNT